MTNNSNRKQQVHNKQTQNEKRSGQETLGQRGQKMDKEDKEGYRSSEQKRQHGNHGGNR